MRATDIIAKKRDGLELSSEEIQFFVSGYTDGSIPDYQAAAWCMAVLLQGMTTREATDITLAMAYSGETLDLSSVAPVIVDKHSTGGVGDKTTLVVAPLVASQGLPVGKMSGRGLSFSGGTIDKLESIPGYQVELDQEQFMEQLAEHGIVVAGQSVDLAPADGKFYSLRDVTATVESLALIAGSIMSKKIAAGADAIVLDVKVGKGAFMKNDEAAEELANLMIAIGSGVGRKVAAVLSDMNQPLGRAVGNALELKEAFDTLQGEGPPDLREHCLTVGSMMLVLANKAKTVDGGYQLLAGALEDGTAWRKFVEWITAQGGDPSVLINPELLPDARLVEELPSPRSAYIAEIDAYQVGIAGVILGGGREKKTDTIDYSVGIIHNKKVGDWVDAGESLLSIHANDPDKMSEARSRLLAAFRWNDVPVPAADYAHTHKLIMPA